MIKAIIFDCFGVLTNDGWKELRAEYCHDDEKQRKAERIDHAVNSGKITYQDFIDEISELTGLTTEQINAKLDTRTNNSELFSYIQATLKPYYKIGLLSNAAEDWTNDMFVPTDRNMFDAVVLSCQVGATKPDPKIFQEAMRQLDVSAEECIFIDDIARYCEGARSIGMKAIEYYNFKRFKQALEVML